jgi:hypothetical protein
MAFLDGSVSQPKINVCPWCRLYIHQSAILLGHLDNVDPEMISSINHVKLAMFSEVLLSQ